jgi:hypothetical protein
VAPSDGGSFRIGDERGAFAAPALEFQTCRDPAGKQGAAHATQQVISRHFLGGMRRALKMNLSITINKRTWECVAHHFSWLHPNLLAAMDVTAQPRGSSENEFEYHFHYARA